MYLENISLSLLNSFVPFVRGRRAIVPVAALSTVFWTTLGQVLPSQADPPRALLILVLSRSIQNITAVAEAVSWVSEDNSKFCSHRLVLEIVKAINHSR